MEVNLSGIVAGDGSGFALNGAATYDYSGFSVSAAGDVNGDGIDDVIIGAPYADPNGNYSGRSYVAYGSDSTPDAFAFTPVTGTAPDSTTSSSPVTITGLATRALISVSGGAYAIDGGSFTTAPGSIDPGAQVAVQVLSSMLYSGTAQVTLTIGTADGVSATFTATTEEATVGVDSPSPFPEGNSGSSQMMIPVSLNGESALPVAVDYDVSGLTATSGVDFQPTSDTLMIPAGATGANVLVDILGDVLDEPDEQLLIQLSNPSAASLGQALATATIQDDDDPPAISISDLQVLEGTSRSQAGLTVSLSAPSGKTVSVDYATADGSALAGQDYTAAAGTVTFAPGITEQSILLDVTSDNLPEPDENFFINLSNPQNATIADAQAEVTILDDDLPRLSINDVGVPEPEDGQQTPANFTVTLQNPILGETVTVDYLVQPISATPGLDYLPATGTLSFPPGTTTQPIGVTVLGDADVESTEQFVVTLSNPSNASIADGSGLGSIYEHTTVIFTDGFESGDTSAWSSEVGGS